jgi:hypothetical protein
VISGCTQAVPAVLDVVLGCWPPPKRCCPGGFTPPPPARSCRAPAPVGHLHLMSPQEATSLHLQPQHTRTQTHPSSRFGDTKRAAGHVTPISHARIETRASAPPINPVRLSHSLSVCPPLVSCPERTTRRRRRYCPFPSPTLRIAKPGRIRGDLPNHRQGGPFRASFPLDASLKAQTYIDTQIRT